MWPSRLPLKTLPYITSGLQFATIAGATDCPVSHSALNSDGTALSSFITFDSTTNTLAITATDTSNIGTFTVRVTSKYLWDGIIAAPRTDYKDIPFTIFCATSLSVSSVTDNVKITTTTNS